jgi:hypothetical protein
MGYGFLGARTKNGCAGDGQRKFTRLTDKARWIGFEKMCEIVQTRPLLFKQKH